MYTEDRTPTREVKCNHGHYRRASDRFNWDAAVAHNKAIEARGEDLRTGIGFLPHLVNLRWLVEHIETYWLSDKQAVHSFVKHMIKMK